MTTLEKLYSIIENSRDVGVKLPKGVLQQVEELEEEIIKKEILPVVTETIAPALEMVFKSYILYTPLFSKIKSAVLIPLGLGRINTLFP